jgi:hypothetical protein
MSQQNRETALINSGARSMCIYTQANKRHFKTISSDSHNAKTQFSDFTNHNTYYTLEPQENKQEMFVIDLAIYLTLHAAFFKSAL